MGFFEVFLSVIKIPSIFLHFLITKIYISINSETCNNATKHTLVVKNNSNMVIKLLNISIKPKIPISKNNDICIDESKIFKNKVLVPGQQISFVIDHYVIANNRKTYKIYANYRTFILNKDIFNQKSNICVYDPLAYTLQIESTCIYR